MPLPSSLNSLTMVRLLQEWVPLDAEPPRQDAAERLGPWLSAFDSVKLDSALQAIAQYGRQSRTAAHAAVEAPALAERCQRVKAELTDLIHAKVCMPPAQALDADQPSPGDYSPHLHRYAALQKQMDSSIAACHNHVRQALSKGSPSLRQLAALDGVMAQMLGERQLKLLTAVPIYLERRFEFRRQSQTDDWLERFLQDMRQLLLAELQMRLQATLGLIEAAHHDKPHPQA